MLVDIFEMCINNVRRIATEKNFFGNFIQQPSASSVFYFLVGTHKKQLCTLLLQTKLSTIPRKKQTNKNISLHETTKMVGRIVSF